MVGGAVGAVRSDASKKLGNPRLVVRNLSLTPDDPHGVKLDGITFDLAAGEILGVAGVAGNGQDELFAALSGEVLEVNAKVVEEPEIVNDDPYGEGWLVRIRLADAAEVDSLLNVDAYKQVVAEA